MIDRMKTMTLGGLCLALALAPMDAPAQARNSEAVAQLYEAAKQEGKVVHWGSPDVNTTTELATKFMELYPGVEVELFKIQTAQAVERGVMAASAGRIEVDVLDATLGNLPLLFERGLVEPFAWQETFGINSDRLMYDSKAVIAWQNDFPIAYNTNLVQPDEIKSWEDLLDPKWRGKLLVEARGLPFAVLALKWGEEKSLAFLDGLMENEPTITKGSTATTEALAGGQGSIAVGTFAGLVERAQGQGAPVAWFPVSPVPALTVVVVPIKGSPHPNAARLWIDFLASAEGGDILDRNMGMGIVKGSGLGIIGKKFAQAGVEVLAESDDAALMQRLLKEVSEKIGALR